MTTNHSSQINVIIHNIFLLTDIQLQRRHKSSIWSNI